ncbi:molybdopterin cofactor-binding domain-containing protein [Polynucleobacter sp. Latsch14-2]|uniref:xanthine dehydrogenase family protein molybdopterin-binding subunit n=1 Tax=Polynucleobacter sp. Latsch14-2 TaxID=2576920 RepID=UPI001C0E1141|nr:molybdopterin cofactor-binding domain-containing protein [Polynucleobacter sp. Latsch14-2]
MNSSHIARRHFLKSSLGLAIGFTWAPNLLSQSAPAALPGSLNANPKLDSWLHVQPDGKVVVLAGKVEFGQGITTALMQIVADELEIDMSRIVMIPTTTGVSPDEGVTSGSQSIEYGGIALRYAAADARELLLERASSKLHTPVTELKIRDGEILTPHGQAATYWSLADGELFQRPVSAKVALKKRHTTIGQSIQRVDIPAKVSGKPAYVQDMKMPGMLHARVIRPPAPRAAIMSVDIGAVEKMPGVVAVIQNGSFLAVVAAREEQAIQAREFLKKNTKWKMADDLPSSLSSWFQQMKQKPAVDTTVSLKQNSVNPATKVLSAQFTKPFIAHASIGPSCAIALMKDGVITAWTHSQGMYPLKTDLVKTLGLPADKIICIHQEGSGMYGQNGADDVALDAMLIAKALPSKPIRVQWMREDEFKWEPYGSAMIINMQASLDQEGNIVDWTHELWSNTHSTRPGEQTGDNLLASWYLEKPFKPSPVKNIPQPAGGSDRNAVPLYVFPNQKVVNHLLSDMPLRVSALRTLGAYANIFAVESMMDDLAKAAKIDPIQFRLKHLQDSRARDVITHVGKMAAWQKTPSASRKNGNLCGRGMAFAKYKNMSVYVACVADVEINPKTGKILVTNLYAAADGGLTINPDGFKNQIEGGLVQTTSWTLFESVPFNRDGIEVSSWAEYPILRFSDVPNVHVEIINRENEKSLGVGEGSQGPGCAAIANAVANALGQRIFDLPLSADRVRAAIEQSKQAA